MCVYIYTASSYTSDTWYEYMLEDNSVIRCKPIEYSAVGDDQQLYAKNITTI